MTDRLTVCAGVTGVGLLDSEISGMTLNMGGNFSSCTDKSLIDL